MTKHSVRVFSDTLRRELSREPIQVVTLEPTFYKTEIINTELLVRNRQRIIDSTPDSIKKSSDVAQTNEGLNIAGSLMNDIARTDVGEVVDTMVAAVTLKHPKPYYRCCSYMDVLLEWAFSHFPETMIDSIFKAMIYNQIVRYFVSLFVKILNKI